MAAAPACRTGALGDRGGGDHCCSATRGSGASHGLFANSFVGLSREHSYVQPQCTEAEPRAQLRYVKSNAGAPAHAATMPPIPLQHSAGMGGCGCDAALCTGGQVRAAAM